MDDNGVLLNVSIIAFDARDYPRLERVITADRVREHLTGLVQKTIVRYAWPHLGALTFTLWPVGVSGVARAVASDTRGRSISSALLHMDLPEIDADSGPRVIVHGARRLPAHDRPARLPVG
jgi:hypothetical protein